jgi:hypothetical protein
MEGNYKLIYHQLNPGDTEFYDLSTDPRELNNLASSKPPQMRLLLTRLFDLNAISPILPGMTPSDVERREKLKSLGYIE